MSRVRSVLSAALVVSMVGLAGCSGDSDDSDGSSAASGATPAARSNADVLAVVQAAGGKATGSGSSRLSLDSTTKVGARSVTFKGQGSFDYASDEGQFDIDLGTAAGTGGGKVSERIVDGILYLSLPGRGTTFYKLKLGDRAGTSGAALLAIEHVLSDASIEAGWLGGRRSGGPAGARAMGPT